MKSRTESPIRLVARVAPIVDHKQRVHRVGPPGHVVAFMPSPDVVVIEEREGSFFVDRYRADGTTCGDTWHQSVDDAKHQCEYEYKDRLGPWISVPDDVEGLLAYAIAIVANS